MSEIEHQKLTSGPLDETGRQEALNEDREELIAEKLVDVKYSYIHCRSCWKDAHIQTIFFLVVQLKLCIKYK